MKPKQSEEREGEKKIRRRTSYVPSDEDRTQLPQATGMKIVKVSQDVVKIQRFIPMDTVGMIEDPASGRDQNGEQQQNGEQ